MEQRNQTFPPGFHLERLFSETEHASVIFFVLLCVYLLALLGNLLVALLIHCDTHLLHTPMYFFLSYLAVADVGFAFSTAPTILHNLVSQNTVISYGSCFSQMYFLLAFGNDDNFLLVVMAYDRYLAICRPLRYSALMNRKRCLLMVYGCWLLAFLHSLLYLVMLSHHSFCGSQEIPHFFCELYPVLELSCSDPRAINMLVKTEGVLDLLLPFTCIVVSYICIFRAIMKIPSSNSKWKAFSTCGSHLAVVVLFYSTLCLVYLQPTFMGSSQKNPVASLMYAVIIPMLNPLIYSFRNQEIKRALERLLNRMQSFLRI